MKQSKLEKKIELLEQRIKEAYEDKHNLHTWIDELIQKVDEKDKIISLIVKGSNIGDGR